MYRCVVDALRSLLRERHQRRKFELNKQLHACEGAPFQNACRSGCAKELPANVHEDIEWLPLVDELHEAVRAAAASAVELGEAEEQSAALFKAMQVERSTCEALRAEASEFHASAKGNSALVGARTNLVQEELANMFDEQARLRDSLRRSLEEARADRLAAGEAEVLCSELELALEESGRVCTELADDRRRQIVALEAYSRKCHSELLTLEDALEQQLDAAELQQVELHERRARFELLGLAQGCDAI